jgi:hypothetical protein
MADVTCTCCGNSYPAGTLRCSLSGALLRRPLRPVEPTVDEGQPRGGPDPHAAFLAGMAPTRSAVSVGLALRVLPDGPTVALPTRLGRESSPIAGLCPDNVSRHHADVYVEHGRVILEDHQSTNGTYVNGDHLPPGMPQVLVEGDLVELGTDPPLRLHVVSPSGSGR